ncbi:MAG TPA: YciI family protein [Streptosporangiaceae bacterium]|jgi:hypothetical protein
MPFFVYGQDRPGAGPGLAELTEAHWSYMDRFAGQLILRGPTLSGDGAEHTGSVHVVDLDDRAAADRFATQEPFWQAGLYAGLTVVRATILLRREPAGMAAGDEPHALVTGTWPPRVRGAAQLARPSGEPDRRICFLAALTTDDQAAITGIAAVAAAWPDAALSLIQPLADQLVGPPAPLEGRRWTAGGRS